MDDTTKDQWMDWERFACHCRWLATGLPADIGATDYLRQVDRILPPELYPQSRQNSGLAGHLHSRLVAAGNNQAIRATAALYIALTPASLAKPPPAFRRAALYLGLLVFMAIGMSMLYQARVLPELMAMAAMSAPEMAMETRDQFAFLRLMTVLILPLLLLIMVAMGWRLSGLMKLRWTESGGGALGWLALPPVRRAYDRLKATLRYPLVHQGILAHPDGCAVSDYLRAAERNGNALDTELQAVVAEALDRLQEAAGWQLRLATAVVAVLVALTIACFLVSAYSPIFAMGDMM